jgi:NitT/TauT family transport system ATP-binding protein
MRSRPEFAGFGLSRPEPQNSIAKPRRFPLWSAGNSRDEPGSKAGMKVVPSRSQVRADPAQVRGQASAMIEIDHVSQIFRTSGRQAHLALSDISLTIEDGAFVSILGPSGCGKSTLLYIVGGFVSPTEGVARVKGRAITGPGPDRGPVFQEFALFPWKTVLGNVMYGPRQQGVKAAEAEAQSRRLIEMVGLKGFENFYPKELSGGMKQRVALARTLAYHPAVLLMDEPFGALDAHTRTRLQNDLLNIWERDRKTVLFVTHSVDEAVFLSDKVVVMTRAPGRIKQIVDIELPRPRRRAELLLDPRYQKYVVEIERMIDDTSEDGLRP